MITEVTKLLGIQYPVIQGGMAWVAEHHLAAAVSEAGGLGLIGASAAPAEWVRNEIREAKKLTDKPFGVNIMLMSPYADEVAKVVAEEGVKVVTTGAGNPEKYMELWKKRWISASSRMVRFRGSCKTEWSAQAQCRCGRKDVSPAAISRDDNDGTRSAGGRCRKNSSHCGRWNCGRTRHGSSLYAGCRGGSDGNAFCRFERGRCA